MSKQREGVRWTGSKQCSRNIMGNVVGNRGITMMSFAFFFFFKPKGEPDIIFTLEVGASL